MTSVPVPQSTAMSFISDAVPGKRQEGSKPATRKSATVTFEPSVLYESSNNTKETNSGSKHKAHEPIIDEAEKEELLALLKDVPKKKAPLHSSYGLLPCAYNLLLVLSGAETVTDEEKFSSDSKHTSEAASTLSWNYISVQDDFSASERRRIYKMVYEVIPLTSVIDELLEDSNFYQENTELYRCQKLVLLMSFNFIQHKFTVKPPSSSWSSEDENLAENETLLKNIVLVAEALWKNRIKLSSSFAKARVKMGAVNLSGMLTGAKKEALHLVASLPQHARLLVKRESTLKQRVKQYREVFSMLEGLNYYEASIEEQLGAISPIDPCYQKSFAPCNHFEDKIVAFSHGACLEDPVIRETGLLLPQDLSSFTAIEKLGRMLEGIKKPFDIVLTHFAQGTEALHMATLLTKEEGNLLVFDVPREREDEFRDKLKKLDISNVVLFNDPFTGVDVNDEELCKQVQVIFCNPPCSLASVPDPINYAMNEGEHLLVPLLSAKRGTVEEAKKYTEEQVASLSHCVKFQKAAVVAYFVRSHLTTETDEVLAAAVNGQKREKSAPSTAGKKKGQAAKNKENKNSFVVKESDFMSFLSDEKTLTLAVNYGYFLATLEKPKRPDEAKSIIDQAISSGLIKWNTEDLETTSNITIEKVKKYKHNYLKPTASVLAKSKQHLENEEFQLSLRKFRWEKKHQIWEHCKTQSGEESSSSGHFNCCRRPTWLNVQMKNSPHQTAFFNTLESKGIFPTGVGTIVVRNPYSTIDFVYYM